MLEPLGPSGSTDPNTSYSIYSGRRTTSQDKNPPLTSHDEPMNASRDRSFSKVPYSPSPQILRAYFRKRSHSNVVGSLLKDRGEYVWSTARVSARQELLVASTNTNPTREIAIVVVAKCARRPLARFYDDFYASGMLALRRDITELVEGGHTGIIIPNPAPRSSTSLLRAVSLHSFQPPHLPSKLSVSTLPLPRPPTPNQNKIPTPYSETAMDLVAPINLLGKDTTIGSLLDVPTTPRPPLQQQSPTRS